PRPSRRRSPPSTGEKPTERRIVSIRVVSTFALPSFLASIRYPCHAGSGDARRVAKPTDLPVRGFVTSPEARVPEDLLTYGTPDSRPGFPGSGTGERGRDDLGRFGCPPLRQGGGGRQGVR